jgi:threonylcarbamoyladenosine tRNA methylthiotransferase MtaB
MHVFPYSPRPGTPAARMPQLNRQVIKERAARLRAAGERVLGNHLNSMLGQEVEVLVEKEGMGRIPQFTAVNFAGGLSVGLARVLVTGNDGASLTGRALAPALLGTA